MENKIQRAGWSVCNFEEAERALRFGIDGLEFRIDELREGGMSPYDYNPDSKNHFTLNNEVLDKLAKFANKYGLFIQWHLPIETGISLDNEGGINVGLKEHHEIAIERILMLEKIYRKFGIGSIATTHGPLVFSKEQQIIGVGTAIENANQFFLELDKIDGRLVSYCIENHTDWKSVAGFLCNKLSDYEGIFKNVVSNAYTFDTGHLRLNKDFTFEEITGYCGPKIKNIHLHSGINEFDYNSFDDDEHQLGTRKNIVFYNQLSQLIKKYRPTVIIEVMLRYQTDDNKLREHVDGLKKELL